MVESDYNKILFQAKIADQSNRPEITFDLIEKLIKMKKEDLNVEERNLLSVSFKYVIATKRAACRKINEIYNSEKENESEHLKLVAQVKENIEKELTHACNRMIDLVDNYLLKHNSISPDSRVFYYKLKGDYYRYLAEFFSGSELSQNSLIAYKQATQYAEELSCTNPIKLGLALNFSVFYYDVMKNPQDAISIANQVFEEGMDRLEEIEESDYKEAATTLQLLKDNIDAWTEDLKQTEGGEDEI